MSLSFLQLEVQGQVLQPHLSESRSLSGLAPCGLRVIEKRRGRVFKTGAPYFPCVRVGKALKVCQKEVNDGGLMTIERNGRKVIEWQDDVAGTILEGRFDVLVGDIDGDNIDELIIAEWLGISNGFPRETWKVMILRDFNPARPKPPIVSYFDVYGSKGTFLRLGTTGKCLILAANWIDLDHPKRGPGRYLEGKFLLLERGKLRPAPDQPVYIRRYLKSFERSLGQVWDSPYRPLLWLQNRKTEVVDEAFLKKHIE